MILSQLHNKKYFKAAVSIATGGGFEKSLETKKNEMKDVFAMMAKNLKKIELNVNSLDNKACSV